MKNSIKKILVILIAILLLCTSITSCVSYDDNYHIYNLWVAGVKVTTRNKTDILGDGTVSYTGNKSQGVLTLKGANLLESSDVVDDAVILSKLDSLTIKLVGQNKVGMGDNVPANGISAYDLTIEGSGSLQVGARASCVMTKNLKVKSGKIETYIKTTDEEVGTILGIGLWAQELLQIDDGDIEIQYLASYSPFSYGIYSAKNLVVNGGKITIDFQTSMFLAIGLISSESIKINGGNINLYAFDDAVNVNIFEMYGGIVNATAVDIFSDGACRLVGKAEFAGGEFTLGLLDEPKGKPTLYSLNYVVQGMDVYGGADEDNLTLKDADYDYIDSFIKIKKDLE